MSPQEQNIAIAEACGWKRPFGNTGDWERPDGSMARHLSIPSYHSDLNACAEFEATLTPIQEEFYRLKLSSITHRGGRDRNVFATAPQRCEAFLRTLNLWKEQP